MFDYLSGLPAPGRPRERENRTNGTGATMFGKKNDGGAQAAAVRQIKAWARELLDPGESATILVSELRCSEPGCPPVETVIALLREGKGGENYKIHRPALEIQRDDVARLAEQARAARAEAP
jgi:hypothetical protein